MKNFNKILLAMALCFCGFGPLYAANSLVTPEDVSKMKRNGISNAIIELLISEQTASVSSDTIITLQRAGANDTILEQVIKGDRYKGAEKAGSSKHIVEILKANGFSQEVIEMIVNRPGVRKEVDATGNKKIIYDTGPPKDRNQIQPSENGTQYHINIERVGK